jgi:hypothetical protein
LQGAGPLTAAIEIALETFGLTETDPGLIERGQPPAARQPIAKEGEGAVAA